MSTRRSRSSIACERCRGRKVRCSVTLTGTPCVSCTQDGSVCTVRQVITKNLRPPPQLVGRSTSRRSASIGNTLRQTTFAGNTIRQSPTTSDATQQCPPHPQPRIQSIIPPMSNELPRNAAPTEDSQEAASQASRAPGALPEEITGAQIISAAFEHSQERDDLPFYTGESAGFSGVLELCADGEQVVRRHVLMSSRSTPLPQEDLTYLQSKGVFSIPKPETCRALLRAYLRHVHPIMPVVDGKALSSLCTAGQPTGRNLLLLWSIFFAAMSFAEEGVWAGENYTSRHDMRNAMYSRAKCMYDISGETDRIILLQSALLLGFYHSEKDLHTQPWYWSGVAISLCQIIGLHRTPVPTEANSEEDAQRRRMARRLWWCSFYRDCWLSLTLGRPRRIDLKDCDVSMPEESDLLQDVVRLPDDLRDVFTEADRLHLAKDWVMLIRLSEVLGNALAWKTRPKSCQPAIQQVQCLEAAMAEFKFDLSECRDSKIAAFSLHHLKLHNLALRTTFYRPFSKDDMQVFPLDQRNTWMQHMRAKSDEAAFQTNMILEQLARDNLLSFAGPMTPPLLVPAMQIHLFNSTSVCPLTRRLGMNKLEFCCMILEEMQNVFDSAAVFRGIFLEAARRIAGRAMANVNGVQHNDTGHARVRQPHAPVSHDADHDADHDAGDDAGHNSFLVPNDEGFNMYDALFGMDYLSPATGMGFWGNFESF